MKINISKQIDFKDNIDWISIDESTPDKDGMYYILGLDWIGVAIWQTEDVGSFSYSGTGFIHAILSDIDASKEYATEVYINNCHLKLNRSVMYWANFAFINTNVKFNLK